MPAILPSSIDKLEAHEIPEEYDVEVIDAFLRDTSTSEGAEIANSVKMFERLCETLRVRSPDYKKTSGNTYCFEEDVKEDKAQRRIDVYYLAHFVFEAKQGVNPKAAGDAITKATAKARAGHSKSVKGAGVRGTPDWIEKMRGGRTQAGRYAHWVTQRGDEKPPFIIVADLGYRFWVWSSFQPDAKDDYGDFELDENAAFAWGDIRKPEVFAFLRAIWMDPASLNEDAIGQRVTAAIAERVCELAERLEERATPDAVGDFLMKCVFTMFAEDVGLIPARLFTKRLEGWIADVKAGRKGTFVRGLRALWKLMDTGGDLDSGDTIKQFNGYLFKNPEPLDLALDELQALHGAAKANWRKVSPAIFGTLLEHMLTAGERQKLGAHYTPEAYIRRLVERVVIEPLRAEWARVRVEMDVIRRTGAKVKEDGTVASTTTPVKGYNASKARDAALAHGHRFRRRLASVRVLDPACGSGNFLYVTMKDMKRLEGEVERELLALHKKQNLWLDIDGESVRPVQFWGIELDSWAAKVADLVLWIGYLQWQVSARRIPRMKEPLIQDLHHIDNRDALIAWRKKTPRVDGKGNPVMRASGVTVKRSDRKMIPVYDYVGVKAAEWPPADYVVGNPPFLGNKYLLDVLTEGYVDAIKGAYPDVNGSADLVMWWWWRAADLASANKIKRFGFITTDSITQDFGRPVVADAVENKGLHIAYAIPEHPWYDEGAAVQIAMTVVTKENVRPVLGTVVKRDRTRASELDFVRVEDREADVIHADLSVGAKTLAAVPLVSNAGICYQGMNLVGGGFRMSREELTDAGYDRKKLPAVLHPYFIGKDLVQRRTERYVIDFYGVEPDDAREQFPTLWDRVVKLVKPERQKNNRDSRRKNWWLFGEPVGKLRKALAGLSRYIVTTETAKHLVFQFVSGDTTPDHTIYAIASDDASHLGVLSSRVHAVWSAVAGATLEDRPRWRNLRCFDPFPFPDATAAKRAKVAKLGEAIDAHRKARQKADPELALTDIYNVIVKLRTGETLTDNDKSVRTRALADTLRSLHDDLDAAVFDAYGWPATLTDDEILTRLVDLNAKRAQEEAKGKIRYLRTAFQAAAGSVQTKILEAPTKAAKTPKAARWPADPFARVGAIVRVLRERDEPMTAEALAAELGGAALADVLMALQNAGAAQSVSAIETDDGEAWIAKA